MHYMPNSYAKHPVFTLMLRALIQTIYRALLTSAVSGVGHRIHTLKKIKCSMQLRGRQQLQPQLRRTFMQSTVVPHNYLMQQQATVATWLQ